MEITAKCIYDLKAVTALHRLQMFKKADPKKRMLLWGIVYGVLAAIILLEILLWQAELLHLIVLLAVVMLLGCYLFFIAPKSVYKAQGNLRDAENIYTFRDDNVHIVSKTSQYSGEAQVEYEMFLKIYETSEYFFLYQTKQQAFIVDKSTIRGGTAEDIRSCLKGRVKKYVLCKY